MHSFRKIFSTLISLIFVFTSVYIFPGQFSFDDVLATVGTPTVADNDTTGFGIDGRDFTVTWTPEVSAPTGYSGRMFFVAPVAQSLTADAVLINECGGSPCQEKGFVLERTQSSFSLPQFFASDSNGDAFTASAYKVCILTMAATPVMDCSASFTPTNDAPADANPPFINHSPYHSAISGVTDAVMYARIFDEQTSAPAFANTGDAGNEYFKMYYGADVSVTEQTPLDAQNVTGELFSFTVPGAFVNANSTFEYYLVASDSSNNVKYFCANPTAISAANCRTSPFAISTKVAGALSIAGTITDNGSGSGLESATVYVGGLAKAAVTAGSGGTAGQYSISNLPANLGGVDIVAYKSGYCDGMRFENLGSTSLTNIGMGLNPGQCGGGFVGGGGEGGATGIGGAPFPVFTDPPQNMGGFPLNLSILVGFSSPLNSATVNDANAADAGSKIYLTTDDGTTKIAGNVTYCETSSSSGCSTDLYPGDTNVVLFNPAADLSSNTFYTLVITSAVTSSDGQTIQGNRPGGGHEVPFSTGGGVFNAGDITTNFGSSGQFMPPYIQSMIPGPGNLAPTNAKILLTFSERMNSATLTTDTVKLYNITGGANTQVVLLSGNLSLDSTGEKLTISPASLSAGQYEVRIFGSVASSTGIALRPPDQAASLAFSAFFEVGAAADVTPPSIYPMISSGATGVIVNEALFFGFSEQLDPSTVNSTNITMSRGSNNVSISVEYDPGKNEVVVIPNTVLAASTIYTINFAIGITDLNAIALTSAQVFTYTTGTSDTVQPKLVDVRCDDYSCAVFFNERMKSDTQSGSGYANSVINPANFTLNSGGVVNLSAAGVVMNYLGHENMTIIKGLAMTAGNSFSMTVGTNAQDVSGNALDNTAGINVFSGKVESSANTFGDFGGGGGMFGPPVMGGGPAGGEFKPEGFGSFTAEQFAFGDADMAFPFSQTAGQDVNVFQVRFKPGQALQNDDQIALIFPTGTGLTNVSADTYSPFFADMNEFAAGTVGFDTAYDADGISVDTAARKVTVQLNVTGTPGANDRFTIDLKKITNPAIPKGPETGGYTVQIKVIRAGAVLISKESMPYYVNQAGANSITINVFAGNQGAPENVAGSLFLFGGGPSGPMDKNLTMAAGIISEVNGTAATEVAYTGLNDGCYFFGTEPYVNLGGTEYFGQMTPEPVCVNGSAPSATKNIILSSASGGSVATLNVEISGVNFGSRNLDIFAGGPGKFVVKTITPGDTTGVPFAATLAIPLNVGKVDNWHVGMGPAMSKGSSMTMPEPLPGTPPPPFELKVNGTTGAIDSGNFSPQGVAFNTGTDTLTFTFEAADKIIGGTVTDGTSPLSNVNVFVHSQGSGAGSGTVTGSDGTFSIGISKYGVYELGAFVDGLNPVFKSIEVKTDGADAGTDPDLFVNGKQITGGNPLVIKLKKPTYTISGKILDSSSNPIPYAPVFGSDASGNPVFGNSGSDGNYTLFVDAGTWTLGSQLPPDKTDECGSFSKTVIVTDANKSSQNISPTAGTCYTLSGTVTIGGVARGNVPVFVEAWNTGTDRPTGALFKASSTDSNGLYTVKVVGSTTYRVGIFDPDYGEISTTVPVVASNITNAHLNSGATGTITFAFTGGTSAMQAFVDVNLSTDKHSRQGKSLSNLSQTHTMTVKEGTYNYFVNIFGFGDFSGTVATGATATIDLSTSTINSLAGNIKDANTAEGANLAGVLVTVKETTSGVIQTDVTDVNGNYSFDALKEGTYSIEVKKTNFVDERTNADKQVVVDGAEVVNFGGAAGGTTNELAPSRSDNTIEGTVFKSDGSTPIDGGFVSARNTTTGEVISAPINPQDGTYDIPVVDGTWEVKANGTLHSKTTIGTVTVSGVDVTRNGTLVANPAASSTTSSSVLASDTGGVLNDLNDTGVKINAGPGVLVAGAENVNINIEKQFTAPDVSNFKDANGSYEVLDDALFDITMSSSSKPNITDLTGLAEFSFNYDPTDLPSGVTEGSLILAYLDDAGNPVPMEGGYTIDQTNNTITGLMNHLTSVVILSPPAVPEVVADNSRRSSGGGGGGSAVVAATTTTDAVESGSVLGDSTVDEGILELTSGATDFRSVPADFSFEAVVPVTVQNRLGREYAKEEMLNWAWSRPYVEKVIELEIAKGYGDGNFHPDWNINRAEFVKMILAAFSIPLETADKNPFSDVSTDDWFADYIYSAQKNEILTGYPDGTFKPQQNVNRAEAMVILARVAKLTTESVDSDIAFDDVVDDSWFAGAIKYAVKYNIVNGIGNNKFDPETGITRGQTAKILINILYHLNKL